MTSWFGGRLRDSVAVAKERSLRSLRLAEDMERRSRSATTSSLTSLHAHGTLTPLAELMPAPSSAADDAPGKTVRFESGLATRAQVKKNHHHRGRTT